jgi:periplasmic divalent cation tolerance protein
MGQSMAMMRSSARHVVVLVTAPDLKTARRLGRATLDARVVACVNLVPRIESHYWWQGRIESGAEVLMILKTTRRSLNRLAQVVKNLHPYETPEIVALPVTAGSRRYLAWLDAALARKSHDAMVK